MSLLIVMFALVLRHTGWLAEPAQLAGQLVRQARDAALSHAERQGWQPGLLLLLVVGLPVALLAGLILLLDGVLGLVVETVLAVKLLSLALLDRPRPDALTQARIAAAEPDLVSGLLDATLSRRQLLQEECRSLFFPLLCFVVLGPVGVLLAYLLRVLAEHEDAPALARRALHWVEWPLSRVLGLGFALAGDFSATWAHWQRHWTDTTLPALDFLEEAAIAAQPGLPGQMPLAQIEASAALLHRTLVLLAVLLALHTLFAF